MKQNLLIFVAIGLTILLIAGCFGLGEQSPKEKLSNYYKEFEKTDGTFIYGLSFGGNNSFVAMIMQFLGGKEIETEIVKQGTNHRLALAFNFFGTTSMSKIYVLDKIKISCAEISGGGLFGGETSSEPKISCKKTDSSTLDLSMFKEKDGKYIFEAEDINVSYAEPKETTINNFESECFVFNATSDKYPESFSSSTSITIGGSSDTSTEQANKKTQTSDSIIQTTLCFDKQKKLMTKVTLAIFEKSKLTGNYNLGTELNLALKSYKSEVDSQAFKPPVAAGIDDVSCSDNTLTFSITSFDPANTPKTVEIYKKTSTYDEKAKKFVDKKELINSKQVSFSQQGQTITDFINLGKGISSFDTYELCIGKVCETTWCSTLKNEQGEDEYPEYPEWD